jgi:NAD(P)-dependent dehydrogenase (short-subunit alcohol dehydrogenase family)
MLTFLLP